MLPRLNKQIATERISGPASPERLQSAPERVLMVGSGNFVRAFCTWMIHELNRQGLFTGRIVATQATPAGHSTETLQEQDGLFTLIQRGHRDGQWVESIELVTAISRGLNPFRDWQGMLALAAQPDLRFVISNTTEAGITYTSTPRPEDCPESFAARMTALLHHRFTRLGGHAKSGLVFLPCELIERNGDRLREVVLRHADDWGLGPDFRAWVERECRFLNTLVDRITPGFPKDEAAGLFERLGYEDRLLVVSELYHCWAVEGDEQIKAELPLHEAGLNVIWTDDVERYRVRKVRILNGTHTTLTPAGLLAGIETVRECLEEPLLGRYAERALFEEILPTLDLPAEETQAFAREVLERFRNPAIHHRLTDIAFNSALKWRVRVLPSVRIWHQANGAPPPALTFSLAALIVIYRRMAGECFRDTTDAPAIFQRGWAAYEQSGDAGGLCRDLLGQDALWGEDLNSIPGFTEQVTRHLQRILCDGVKPALSALEKTT